MNDTTHERMRMHLVQALTRSDEPNAQEHIRAAIDEIDTASPPSLDRCPVCYRLGLPEQIASHTCES
jgi:hypothetical protein